MIGDTTNQLPQDFVKGDATNQMPPDFVKGDTNHLPPDFVKDYHNQLPPDFVKCETNQLPPDFVKSETNQLPPDFVKCETNQLLPDCLNGDQLPPDFVKGDQLPPDCWNGDQLPPDFAKGDQLPPDFAKGDQLPPDFVKGDQLPLDLVKGDTDQLAPRIEGGLYSDYCAGLGLLTGLWRGLSIRIMIVCGATTVILILWAVVGLGRETASDHSYLYEKDPAYWYNVAQSELAASLKEQQRGVAKNVILFLGDGMGPTSVTAGRILAGQMAGLRGEEHKLSFDHFPYTGLSRTYNVDSQVTDSAASGTAYMTAVKTNQGLLGLSGAATRGSCASTRGAEVDSILRWSARSGKSTGVVTTTRITHATPASSYAHSADRDWESDRLIPHSERACEDIALQLVSRNRNINVIMGGGRAYFYPEGFTDPDPDPSFNTSEVSRLDRRNLIQEWRSDKTRRRLAHHFVYDKKGLDRVNLPTTDYLLGLFSQGHMTYDLDRNTTREPSIADMTWAALQVLRKNKHGFFLLVEGGMIDQAHHDSRARYALTELVAMAEAVDVARKLTDEKETLIVVTADHSHVMDIAGYALRGTSIFGVSNEDTQAIDKKPYTTLLYGAGPGYTAPRENLTGIDTANKSYVFQSAVPRASASHGGEDVTIYASGPHSFLYTGVHEQNYIPMVMAYASCVGPYSSGGKPCAGHHWTSDPQQAAGCPNGSQDGRETTRWCRALTTLMCLLLLIWQ